MKKISLLLSIFIFAALQAQTIQVACGPSKTEGAYDALDENDPSKAAVYFSFKPQGANNKPKILSLIDGGSDLIKAGPLVQKYQKISISNNSYSIQIDLELANFSKYKFSLKNCNDLSDSSGELAFTKYVGGFAGGSVISRKMCNCKEVANR